MSNFNKYLKDINAELFDQLAKKHKRKELLYGIVECTAFVLSIIIFLYVLFQIGA